MRFSIETGGPHWTLLSYFSVKTCNFIAITFYIESDASLLGMGAVMSQNVMRNGKKSKNILGFYSKRYRMEHGTHNKYSSVFREVLLIISLPYDLARM